MDAVAYIRVSTNKEEQELSLENQREFFDMDVIKCADWVVDLGPEAGDRGGSIVFEGTPDGLAGCKESYTGRYLALREKNE